MISFENVPAAYRDRVAGWQEWLPVIARHYGSKIKILHYLFMDDEAIEAANLRHLDHHYPTDIITFGYEEGKSVAAEMLIGYQTIEENAASLAVRVEEELDRVVVHGLLHLIGFDDKEDSSRQKMREAEENCLILRPKILIDN